MQVSIQDSEPYVQTSCRAAFKVRCAGTFSCKGGGGELKNIFYSADGEFENILKQKIFHSADEVFHIKKYFVVQTDLKKPKNILNPYFIVQTKFLKIHKNILKPYFRVQTNFLKRFPSHILNCIQKFTQ